MTTEIMMATQARCSANAGTLKRPLVLCVDDDPEITRLIKQILGNYNVDVVPSAHGQQGIWQGIRRHPDVIITDLRMPQGTGEDLILSLKGNSGTAKIPIIVFTGLHESRIDGRMKRLGVDAVLHKPLHSGRLLEEIGRFIPLKELEWG